MKTAYPQTHTTCSIRLYSNIPFDNTYQHHSIISELFTKNGTSIYGGTGNVPAKESFINRKKLETGFPYYYPRYDLTGEFNFNFVNGLLGSVVLELTAEQTNANYLRLTCGNDIYYYFITSITQVNADTYNLTLELDVLMTYQDEFLTGMKDVPISIERKHSHRYAGNNNNNWVITKCCDYKNNEYAFSGVKPSIVEDLKHLSFKGDMSFLNNVLWVYYIYETIDNWTTKINNSDTGVQIYCCPLKTDKTIVLKDPNNNLTITLNNLSGQPPLINEGKLHGIKISPYPPFNGDDLTYSVSGNIITISSPNITILGASDPHTAQLTNSFCSLRVVHYTSSGHNAFENDVLKVQSITSCNYEYNGITLPFILTSKPNKSSVRKEDPRLLFAPFKKYAISSPYGKEYEFYPELKYSDYYFNPYTTGSDMFYFESIASPYLGDSTLSTYIKPQVSSNNNAVFKDYKMLNFGLSCVVNYSLPAGTNALDVFNSTQAQAYYQSKTASSITAGLTIAGGIGTTILGIVSAVGSYGMSTPASVGLIAGGVATIGSGVASAVNTSKSITAKIEDLQNTPDSINVAGSNIFVDTLRTGNHLLPYITQMCCSDIVRKNADDLFYHYGYAIGRNCYFNTELEYNNRLDNTTDDNIFTRDIFNYVKSNEDITNKINADIPLIIKQKLSSIFNNGITLWSLFTSDELWYLQDPTSSYYVDKWFLKDVYENPEINF